MQLSIECILFIIINFFQIAEKEYFKSLQRIEYTYKEMTHEMKDEKYRMKETKLIDWLMYQKNLGFPTT